MSSKVRVRFAPSPTGGLHLGGVRTVLYNYLFAKQHGGDFIVRIEDTDQSRYVAGAENYIFNCLKWAGLEPDESPVHGGEYGPYHQSERKEIYRRYAEQLVKDGYAYYAFDTTEELEKMRHDYSIAGSPSQYDHKVRMYMNNQLRIGDVDAQELVDSGMPYVIRIKMPEDEQISFTDMIRGEVSFDSSVVDDKVLLKADGMPTYHLAVVVDDSLMKISHAFRGEEWLPSAPVHVLLWKYLFGLENMPQWAHLPLILGPNGKLSKRDGARYGFPVFAMSWTDPTTGELTEGFKEKGFLPGAFINLLALLGWNDGSEQELFNKEELIAKFSIEKVHSGGAKFDYEKARWFNHEYIKMTDPEVLLETYKDLLPSYYNDKDDAYKLTVFSLVKDRCHDITDLINQSSFFFKTPEAWDTVAVKPKWNEEKKDFFVAWAIKLAELVGWDARLLEQSFKDLATEKNIKPGELQLPLRIMLVGGKFGPPVFTIAELLGTEETFARINKALLVF